MQSRAWGFIFVFSLLCIGTTALADTPKDLTILRVTPSGVDVPASRQIVLEFNRPVVAVGKMERTAEEVGITVSPSLNCQWRWLNTSSLSCNLDDKDTMVPATRYTVHVEPTITAQDGGKLVAAADYDFMTQRPAISYNSFKTWRGPGSPVIRLTFNQPISKSSLNQKAYITVSGSETRAPMLVTADEDNQQLPDYLFVPGTKTWVQVKSEGRSSDDQKISMKGEEARRVWLVEPTEELPADTTATFGLDTGLVSAFGTETNEAKAEVVTFDTYPDFAFAGVRCMTNDDTELFIDQNSKTTGDASLCNPMRPVALAFTSPILRSHVQNNVTFTPDLAGGRTDFNPWGDENRDWSGLGSPHKKGNFYYVGLPIGLKAAKTYTVSMPGPLSVWEKFKNFFRDEKVTAIEDEMGRTLKAPATLTFSTNNRNPNFELPYNDAVLESGIDSQIPLYVNNLNSVNFKYRSVTAKFGKTDQSHQQTVNKVDNIQYAVPLDVRAMLNGKSGAVYGFLETAPVAPNKWDGSGRLFAQVTPWQAHLKLGHFSSLIWVTDMATGKPVQDVRVRVYRDSFTKMSSPTKSMVTVTTDANGMAELPGTATLDPEQDLLNVWKDEEERLFVRLDKGDDMAILPLASAFSLSTWNFSTDSIGSYTRDKYGHLKSWGFTAQGIYRAGDTMQYKIFLRNQDDKTLVPPPQNAVYNLEIQDPMGNIETIEDIKFSEFGAYSGEYEIPESASVGWYEFHLVADFRNQPAKSDDQESEEEQKGVVTLTPMSVLVSDFTPAPFRVITELNGSLFRPTDTVDIETRALMHSGGPYGDASARATVTLKQRSFSSDNPVAKDFTFGSSSETYQQIELLQKTEMLNDKGEWIEKFTIPEQPVYYGKLEVESAVQDDRGKSVASVASADYVGVDRLVGLKSPQWFYESKKPVSLQTIVVDENGVPVAGTAVAVSIEFEEINVAKVKGAGNAYLSDITREWKQVATCENTSTQTAGDCTFTPKSAGSYKAIATIEDQKGRVHTTDVMLWVSGEDYVQWNDQDNLALSIIPEKKSYKVGDTAKFLVKNPYPGAMALVTVERYGIVDRFTQTLEGSSPVIELPVKADYLPGFYLSVLVVSPRVDQPAPEMGQVDMGKPGFRMGYVQIAVKDPYKEITVDIKTPQEVYRPGDTIKVSLAAQPRHVPDTKQPIELAVAVLDESVFDLITAGKAAFDPYNGFYELDQLDMRNYSLLYRLIGKQKFEKKGANAGGDGGNDVDMRTLFKYVSYWNPSVATDANGKAEIEFKTPDNLTGWRVLAIATTPGDRLGLGEGNFKVNRPTEVRPVMPNQVHEGDQFVAGFSVMNRTDKKRTLQVTLDAEGDAVAKGLSKTENVTLEPYKRITVYLPLEAKLLPVTREAQKGVITFKATAGDEEDSDGTVYTLPVLKKRSTDVAATYGTTTEDKVEETIAFPADIYTDTGDVSVVLSPSVIGNITGAFRYMRDYPYLCWEQILTKSVMAAQYQELKPWIPASFEWKDSATLTKEMLSQAANFQAPNGGMAYFVATDDRADPYLSAYTALAFSWLKQDGYTIPEDVETNLHTYLLNFLRQDAAPDFYQAGMTSTVRAVALAALARENKVTADDVIRYRSHLKEMSLFGKANFMQAALRFDKTQSSAKEAADMIFAAGSESGGKFVFSETLDDGYVRLLTSQLRDNCAVLSGFLAYKEHGANPELIGDKPFKLVRTITQSRGSRDHWENTQENMFCMNALVEYAKAYESVEPDMTVTAKLAGQEFGKAEFGDVKDNPVTLVRPIESGDAGKTQPLLIEREGDGRLYYAARLRYAPKDADGKTVNAGMDIQREYSIKRDGSWTILKDQTPIKRGDTVRIDLYLSLPTARNYVVVNDPLPGALETVNRDLATASGVDDEEAQYDEAGGSLWFKYNDWTEFDASFWSFYHKELRNDSARFYADRLPAGNYHLSYMTQAIADGSFAAPPTKAEEMYDPDIYGRSLGTTLIVKTDK